MKIYPIQDPLDGERVVGVEPELENFQSRDWRSRLNSYPGRALSHMALTADQVWRSGHIASLGTLVSPGVINGLEVSLYGSDKNLTGASIHISPGKAIDHRGEVVTLTHQLEVAIKDIFVYEHATQVHDGDARHSWFELAQDLPTLDELIAVEQAQKKKTTSKKAKVATSPELLERALVKLIKRERIITGRDIPLKKFDQFITLDLPHAMVLVLEPVFADINVEHDAADPCEQDADLYAFENWQQIDAFRLVFYTWPESWLPLPAHDEQWRNVLAANIFHKERELDPAEHHPWEGLGIPISLFGFSTDWELEFIDRNAVVRQGGRQRRTTSLIPGVGNHFLWQAQFQQFNEHLADLVSKHQELEIEQIVEQAEDAFRYLPPVGILPKQFAQLRAAEQEFFPVKYQLEALSIPYEQLDLVIRDSAPLAELDTEVADRVQMLAPVPQQYYEPDLLKVAEIDVEFDETIRRFSTERNTWLGRRLNIRRKLHWLNKVLVEKQDPEPEPDYLKPDPNALDNLEMPTPFVKPLIEVGEVWRVFKGTQAYPETWHYINFNDSGSDWQSLSMGIGYGTGEFETELDDMHGNYVGFACRKLFTVEDEQQDGNFYLDVTTNGGFALALNGSFIYEYNFSSGDHTMPSAQQEKQVYTKTVKIDDELLYGSDTGFGVGTNVLAIKVQGRDLFADEFIFVPRLYNKTFTLEQFNDPELAEEDFGTTIIEGEGEADVDENMEPLFEIDSMGELNNFLGSDVYAGFEVQRLENLGLKAYIENLKKRINNTNDLINHSFGRVQTEIYRVRRYMLGDEAATKLATFPTLASIAKLDSAAATREELKDFSSILKANADISYSGFGEAQAVLSGAVEAKVAEADGFALIDDQGGSIGGGGGFSISSFGSSAETKFIPVGSSDGGGTQIFGTSSLLFQEINLGGTEAKIGSSSELVKTADAVEAQVDKSYFQLYQDLELLGNAQVLVEEQSAIVGGIDEVRSTTIGERLEVPAAVTVKTSSVATKAEIIRRFLPEQVLEPASFDEEIIHLDNLKVPGFRNADNQERIDVTISLVRANNNELLKEILAGLHDKSVKLEDAGDGTYNVVDSIGEGDYFNASVRALENASTLLRRVERRTHAYKQALDRAVAAYKSIAKNINRGGRRLSIVETELAEARHDVSVSRAMRAEEQARIDAINARRDSIYNEHVPFLVFRRPRLTEARTELPVMTLNPDLPDDTLPACNIDETDVPQEISAMMDTLREAPIKWFTISDKVLNKLDRIEYLHVTIQNAYRRARTRRELHPFLRAGYDGGNRIRQGIGRSLMASYRRINQLRLQTARLDINRFRKYGWKQTASQAREVISFGDIIDGNHGRPDAAQLAAKELQDFTHLTTCLYLRFGEVLPSIRLDWAERLSQFDKVGELRNLFSLPRWEEIDFIERTEMQSVVDALYRKINNKVADAREQVSELVRIALLVASHAPVNKLLAGEVKEPVTVGIGSDIDIDADISRVHIGMMVMVQSGLKTIARAVVDDIVGGKVKARIVHTAKKNVRIERNSRVQIGKRRNFGPARPDYSKFLRRR